jgi:hypothetical protein
MSTLIPLAALDAFRSPFENDVWRCGLVSMSMVAQALKEDLVYDYAQWQVAINESPNQQPSAQQHAARIAYLVKNGWDDPIDIDVGVPSLGAVGHWPYTDGNHRICAAILRGDTHIRADISGDVDYAEHIFGVEIMEIEETAS